MLKRRTYLLLFLFLILIGEFFVTQSPANAFNPGDNVFVIEKVECSTSLDDWITFYQGTVTTTVSSTTSVQLSTRYGYRFHPEEEGEDPTNWWCIPKKKHCYSQVGFRDWGGTYYQSQVFNFPSNKVISADAGITSAMESVLASECGRTTTSPSSRGDDFCKTICTAGTLDPSLTTCTNNYPGTINTLVETLENNKICRKIDTSQSQECNGTGSQCVCAYTVETSSCDYSAGDTCNKDTGSCTKSTSPAPTTTGTGSTCGPAKEFKCVKEDSLVSCGGPQPAYDSECASTPGAKCCQRESVNITNPTTTTSADKNCTAKTEAEGLGPFSFSGALVPCGRKCQDDSTPNDETAECTLCHLLLLGQNIFNLAKSLLILASILFLTIAGVILIVSTGDSGMKSLAKGIITKTLTGFALFMLAWLMVQTLLKVISFNSSVLKSTNWFEYSCDTTSAFNSATSFQQVQDGAGSTTAGQTPSGTSTGGTCSASSELPETTTIKNCVLQKSAASGITAGQVMTFQGSHVCKPDQGKISCHYGGTKCNGKSNAIDFGGPSGSGGGAAYAQLVQFASACGAATARCEDAKGNTLDCNNSAVNHIHVNAKSDCGCN